MSARVEKRHVAGKWDIPVFAKATGSPPHAGDTTAIRRASCAKLYYRIQSTLRCRDHARISQRSLGVT